MIKKNSFFLESTHVHQQRKGLHENGIESFLLDRSFHHARTTPHNDVRIRSSIAVQCRKIPCLEDVRSELELGQLWRRDHFAWNSHQLFERKELYSVLYEACLLISKLPKKIRLDGSPSWTLALLKLGEIHTNVAKSALRKAVPEN